MDTQQAFDLLNHLGTTHFAGVSAQDYPRAIAETRKVIPPPGAEGRFELFHAFQGVVNGQVDGAAVMDLVQSAFNQRVPNPSAATAFLRTLYSALIHSEQQEPVSLPMVDLEVWRCVVDQAFFGLVFLRNRRRDIRVHVEGRFQLRTPEGTYELDAHHPDIARAVALLRKCVTDAAALADGTLVLKFAGGFEFRVPPDWMYEAWEVEEEDRYHLICAPGGQVAGTVE